MKHALAIFIMLGLLSACACTHTSQQISGYFGPTDSMDQVIAGINSNNSKIPTLWARQAFNADIVDDKGESHFVNGFGKLLFSSPDSIYLSGKKELADLFEMGCNDQQFWLHMIPDQDVLYWGNTKNIGKPCMQSIPIRPDLILQVLGISQIDIDLTRQPVPVMRFNNISDAYMLVWQTLAGDHWVAQKEIWYDRATLHPELVLLFDSRGREVLRAKMANYRPVRVSDTDKKTWPMIATHYVLYFPDSRTKMSFDLSDVTVSQGGFPKPASFRIPDLENFRTHGVKVIQIDEDCGS